MPPNAVPEPKVSILIIATRGLEKTRACLESVLATAPGSPLFEILVVDDASTDGTTGYLQSLGAGVRVLHNKSKASFSHSNNMAAKEARGEFLCLLSDDTTVTAGWLEKLLVVVEGDPTIGLAGNRHIDLKTGLIRHAGMVFNTHGKPLLLYKKQPADFWPALVNQEFQILKATCWLVRKRLYLELGGFDTDFDGGYEDIDFCLRVRQSGYKCFYIAESVIYCQPDPVSDPSDQEIRNWELFQCKWGASISPDLESFYLTPEPKPEVKVQKTTHEAPAKRSHIEERYTHVEALHAKHPLIASVLRTIIRSSISTAKLLNRRAT